MIRLVKTYHPDLLPQTHCHLARVCHVALTELKHSCPLQELEADHQFAQAEHHFVAGEDWKAAVNMYDADSTAALVS